ANVDLHVVQPTSTADTLRLIDAGKAEFGLADGADVADQIDLGRDAEAVMAVVQHPLGGLIALRKEGLSSPRDLEGRTVGLTGVAPGLVRAVVAATVRGYQDTLEDPSRSLRDLLRQNPSLQSRFTQASLQAYLPLFKGDASSYGVLRSDRVSELSAWLLRYRL